MTYALNPFRFPRLTRTFPPSASIPNIASGSMTIPLPPGGPGQMLVAQIGFRDSPLFSAPAGWTIAFQGAGDIIAGGLAGIMVAYKTRGPGETDPTFTRTGGSRARGIITGYQPNVGSLSFDSFTENNAAASSTVSVSSLTSVGSKSLLVVFAVKPLAWSTAAAGLSAASLPAAPTSGTFSPEGPEIVNGAQWTNAWLATQPLGPSVGMQGFDLLRNGAGASGTISVSGVLFSTYRAVAANFSWLP